jgi:hypothetical protein
MKLLRQSMGFLMQPEVYDNLFSFICWFDWLDLRTPCQYLNEYSTFFPLSLAMTTTTHDTTFLLSYLSVCGNPK